MNELIKTGGGGAIAVAGESTVTVNPAAVYLASLAPGSRPTMRRALEVIAGVLTQGAVHDVDAVPWHRIRFEHAAAVRSELAARYAFSTVNRQLSALRGVLKAAWRLGLMSAEEYRRAADVQRVTGERVVAGRAVEAGELAALLGTCEQDARGIRDAAIIAMLYAGGLRRAELVGLDLSHYERAEGGGRLTVKGKGNKERVVPLAGGAARALDDSGCLFDAEDAGHGRRGPYPVAPRSA